MENMDFIINVNERCVEPLGIKGMCPWWIKLGGVYSPDEIRNSMFLTLMKKALIGGIGGRRQN